MTPRPSQEGRTASSRTSVLLLELLCHHRWGVRPNFATARAEAQFVYRVQTIGGFGGKSDQLNAYNVFTGSPGYMQADRDRYARATAASVAAAAQRWLRDAPRVALSVVPRGQSDLALPGSEPVFPA